MRRKIIKQMYNKTKTRGVRLVRFWMDEKVWYEVRTLFKKDDWWDFVAQSFDDLQEAEIYFNLKKTFLKTC